MKKVYSAILVIISFWGSAGAQTVITDSIETGAAYANDVYYSLKNGIVSQVPNNNWQLGFSVGSMNVAIRANTGVSSTNDGRTVIYEMPGTDHNWSPFDTTDYKTWPVRNNSDTDWQAGALNYPDPNIPFDYGWGKYDMSTHVVSGHRLYLAVVTSGSSTLFKKIWVRSKASGTWNISFANIDGTDSVGLSLASTTYITKNFVYVSLVTGAVVDREPAKTDWDFIYTRYLPNIPGFPTVTGILTNAGVATSEVRGIEETTSTLADTTTTPFSNNISVIGSDWKAYNFSTNAYTTTDSLTYFVKAKDGAFWKLVFTGFVADIADSSRPGRAIFTKAKLTPATGVVKAESRIKNVAVYPNPASSTITVLFDTESKEASVVSIFDMAGKQVLNTIVQGNGFQQHNIDLSRLNSGIYFLNLSNGAESTMQKIVISK